MKNYNAYFFDFDYTLADSEAAILSCFHHVFEINDFIGIDDDAIRSTIGLTLKESFKILTGISSDDILAAFRKQYVAKADEIMTDQTRFYPDALALIDKLSISGAILGIISNKFRYRIEETLAKSNLIKKFDIIIGADDVKQAKPDPEGLLIGVRKTQQEKTDVLYVGDSLVDCQTAENAGIDFVAVTTGFTKPNEFLSSPHIAILSNLGKFGV